MRYHAIIYNTKFWAVFFGAFELIYIFTSRQIIK